MIQAGGVAAIEMAEAQVEDLGLDILGFGGMDRLAQFLDEELEELGACTLQRLSERLGGYCTPDLLAELGGQVFDGRLGMAAPELKDRVIAVLGRVDLVG